MKRGFTRVTSLLLFAMLVLAGAAAVYYKQNLYDWWVLRSYTPPTAVKQLADESTATDYGRRVFYVAKPSIDGQAQFNEHCGKRTEKTIVLGCYNGRRIYIYNVDEPQLDGVKQVTAMHEMLHAAYQRLSGSERRHVNDLLQTQLTKLNDPYVNDLVSQYQKSEPGEVDNELHSILGTEVADVGAELEAYYKQYFANREKVVAFANQYRAVFEKSEARISDIDAKLGNLKTQINANEVRLREQEQALQAQAAHMNQLKASGDIAAYNAAVDPYNQQVRDFNALIATTKDLIATHNALVAERNRLATAHNNLANSLNSNFKPLPTE